MAGNIVQGERRGNVVGDVEKGEPMHECVITNSKARETH